MLDADAGWTKGKVFRIPVHVYDRYAAFALIFSDYNNTIVNDVDYDTQHHLNGRHSFLGRVCSS